MYNSRAVFTGSDGEKDILSLAYGVQGSDEEVGEGGGEMKEEEGRRVGDAHAGMPCMTPAPQTFAPASSFSCTSFTTTTTIAHLLDVSKSVELTDDIRHPLPHTMTG